MNLLKPAAQPGSANQPTPSRVGRKEILYAGFWTLLVVVFAAEAFVTHEAMGLPVPWWYALRRSAEEWYLWAVLSVGVIWVSKRFPLTPGRMRRALVVHSGVAVYGSVIYLALWALILHGQWSYDGSILAFSKVFQKLFLHYFCFNVGIYWVIVMGQHGWHYYQEYRQREQEAAALTTELVQAKLEALRMQLQPHFLFNTLHTISALIHDNPEAADRMVARLSELLRLALDQAETQEVPLRQELAFLERYLDIERIRFQDRLELKLDLEPGLESMLVPSLVLQPLVENAIRHGIEAREEMGRIEIAARRRDGMLELTVSDNGSGLPEPDPAPRREGIGLTNTRSRLRHLYGDAHRLELNSPPGGGLEVRLVIPCRAGVAGA